MSIFDRGKVKWYKFKFTLKRADGTKERYLIQRSARTRNKRKAEEVQEEHHRQLRLGLMHPLDPFPKVKPPQAPSVRDFGARFLEYTRLRTKPSTVVFYETCFNRVCRVSALADCLLDQVTSETVGKYIAWRQAAEGSVVSINGELRTLRRLFRLAAEWGVVSKGPAIHELPGAIGRDRVVSFKEESLYMLHASENLKDATIICVDTGVRPDSELFVLEWNNVHLERTTEAPHGFIHVRDGKSKSAVRNVPLTPRARQVMENRKVRSASLFVFPGDGNTGHIVSLQHAHEKAIQNSGVKPFVYYTWRHTFGTRCAESGMDRYSLANLMGHSSPRVAERYYIHVTESHVCAGFERFIGYQEAKLAEMPQATNQVQ